MQAAVGVAGGDRSPSGLKASPVTDAGRFGVPAGLVCQRNTVPSLFAATLVRPSRDTAIASTVLPTVVPALGPCGQAAEMVSR